MPRKKKRGRLVPRNPHAVKAAARHAGPMKDRRRKRADDAVRREVEQEAAADDR